MNHVLNFNKWAKLNEEEAMDAMDAMASTDASGDAPGKDFSFPYGDEWRSAKKIGVKFGNDGQYETGPLVYQSPTSVTEASTVLQNLIKVMGTTGTKENEPLINALAAINANNYYALLWKVRYGKTFRAITKSKGYDSITDWISTKGYDHPSAKVSGTYHSNKDELNPMGAIRDIFQDPAIFNALNRLQKYNEMEQRQGKNI